MTEHRPSRRLVIAVAVLVLLVAVVLVAWSRGTLPGRASAGALTATGTLEADEVVVAARVNATITSLPLAEGSPVVVGDTVATLDDRTVRLQVEQAPDPATKRVYELQEDDYRLKSPRTGIITRVPAHVGELAFPGAVLLAVSDLTTLKLTIYVREADLARVHTGQHLAITAVTFPSRTFSGTVTSINQQAEFTPRNVQTTADRLNLVFGVQATVDNHDSALKPGMTIDAEFLSRRGYAVNMGRLAAIIRKEVIQIRRDRFTLGLVIGIPVMELLLFGYALNTVTDHISTVVADESGTASSRDFVGALEHSTYFDVKLHVTDREAAMAAIDRGAVRVALLIPPDFGDRVLAGQATTAQLIVDGSDPNIAQTATFAGGLIAQVQSAVVSLDVASRVGPVGRTAPAIDLRPVVLYNPQMLSVQAMIPALVGLVLQLQAVLLTALAIVRERERGTLEQLIVSPIRSSELMLGKTLPNIVLCLISTVMALAVGYVLFGVHIHGSIIELLVLTLPFLFGSLGIGLAISVVAKNQSQALQMTMFTLLPSLLLSGFLFAREGMPTFFQVISLLIPMTHYLQILRGVILKGVGISVLWPQALILTVFAVAVLGASITRFRKSIE